jgi:tRNA-binding protein
MKTSNLLQWNEFKKIDIRVGKILEVSPFPEAIRPAYRLLVDFGHLGTRKSSAQITNYRVKELVGRQVVAVVNFPQANWAVYLRSIIVRCS